MKDQRTFDDVAASFGIVSDGEKLTPSRLEYWLTSHKHEPRAYLNRIAMKKKHEWLEGLSVRAKTALINAGFESQYSVKSYVIGGTDLKRLHGIGHNLEIEIKKWIGI